MKEYISNRGSPLQLVERHIVKKHSELEHLCSLSKCLYNKALYEFRQAFCKGEEFLTEFELSKKLSSEDQFDYRNLPAQTSQQVLRLLYKNIKSYFSSIKDYEKNPDKYTGKPRIPKYKEKLYTVVFTNQQVKLKDGHVHFPKKVNLKPLKTKCNNVQQVRIIPQSTCFVVEVVYNVHNKQELEDNRRYLSLDLGLNNYISAYSNVEQSFIINGKVIKSYNQFYNKTKSKLQSFVGDKGSSKRLRRLLHKRNCWIEDKNHKISRFIVNYCLKHNLNTIVIGNNKSWKQNINLGKKTNRRFVEIPHKKLIDKIEYKANKEGIRVVVTEESYTSKVDSLALEELKKHDNYKGRRVKRGLFQSSCGKLINADINGSINILRKVIGDGKILFNRGFGYNPKRFTIV